MNIFVLNAGSSSLKLQLINIETGEAVVKISCERLGAPHGRITYRTSSGGSITLDDLDIKNHQDALERSLKLMTESEHAVIKNMSEIGAVGHRVSNGGNIYPEPTLLNKTVMAGIDRLAPLAPLHNPPALLGMYACFEVLDSSIPQVALFDTSFHRTIPKYASTYAIPYELTEKYEIRKFGFHGVSHHYIRNRLAELVGSLEGRKVVSCHLGSGSSLAAIKDGVSVENSMGFTPLNGLPMNTRSGSLDPSVVTFLQKHEKISPERIEEILWKESGLIGVSGLSGDTRDLERAGAEGNERAQLAIDMLYYHIRKTIGEYAAAMCGLDTIVFTGGIGENSAEMRADVCGGLEFMGVKLDPEKNLKFRFGAEGRIDSGDSKIALYVIPTNEELLIAQQTYDLIKNTEV